ncbi:adenosylcobinamide-GDP ribazoletransferase [Natronomonas salina]|uniref:adenosylcobinamide-GDP ribazoletransferase n=1 Tax=Natronomonas salina TaxID=1710540 RepID=UPI0015B5033D|nr:adenosylcobinamide-GDP ribazoletransferase [Natronomonas salina]QLD90170.1 adenosylcobinamide-GDP ribazoletransferase [Natronomonas salina]
MALNEIASGLRGGVAFLTRLPVESRERDWLRFQEFPAAFPLVGYLVGALAALPFLVLPGAAAAFAYLLALVAVTGIAHLDGVADLGDAAAVHEDDGRRDVLKDTTVGVGAVSAVAVVVAGLALAGLALAGLPEILALLLVIAAEVGAKLGMATVACIGTASHEGIGSQFTRNAEPALLAGPALAAVPAALLTFPSPAALVAVLTGPVVAVSLVGWGERHVGGVNGDVFGAVNELGRVAALHAGVVTWMYF